MAEAIRVRVRYDQPDEKGISRRERNIQFGRGDKNPDFEIPLEGFYLWCWYWTISARLRRVIEGVAVPISPAEFLAWCEASDTIITAVEYGILCAMDDAFINAMSDELENNRLKRERAAENG